MHKIKQIVDLLFNLYFYVSKIFKKISLQFIKLLNFLIAPNKMNGRISNFKKIIMLLFIFIFVFSQYIFNLNSETSIILYLSLVVISVLYFIGKKDKIQEDMDIYNGFLKVEKKVYIRLDSMFSSFMVISFLTLFFLSLLILLINVNYMVDDLFLVTNHDLTMHENFIGWVIFLISAIPIIGNFFSEYIFSSLNLYQDITFTEVGNYLNTFLYFVIFIIIYTTIKNYYDKFIFEKKLLNAIEEVDGDANINSIQQKMSLLPNAFKKDLLDKSINNNNDIIKRRMIMILFYSKTISFPQTFLYNLSSQSYEIKKLGLKKIYQLLEDNSIEWDSDALRGILTKAIYQVKKEDKKSGKNVSRYLNDIIIIIKNKKRQR